MKAPRYATSPIILSLLLVLAQLVFAGPSALADETGGELLGFHIAQKVPPDLGISELCCTDLFATQTPHVTRGTTALGESVTWLRIAGPLPAGLVQVSPIVDRATLFVPDANGDWTKIETGDMVANSTKLFPSPFMALPLPDSIGDGPVFIRIVQDVPVSIRVRHWDLPAFSAMQSQDKTLKVLLLGMLGAMIFYNLLVSVVVRDPAFALNAISISALLVIALYLSGYGAAYVWSAATGLSNTMLLSALLAAIVSGGVFIWLFLRSAGEPLRRGWPLLVPPTIASVLPFTLFVFPNWLVTVLALVTSALLFATAFIISVRRTLAGEPKARILLMPLLLAMIPGTAMVALDKYLGVQLLQFGNNGMEITLCFEAVLFSLALASRIRVTEAEARLASERIVALQNEAATRSIAAQDKERRRLAKELHDGVGQDFLVVLGGLKQISGLPAATNLVSRLDILIGAASNALANLRSIARDMHPASLEHLGLARAVTELVKQAEAADAIAIISEIDINEEGMDADTRLHIYRIVQECLSNTLRHAQANRCWVCLIGDSAMVRLIVEDDGIGFAAGFGGEAGSAVGLGLASIGERVKACGGRWSKGVSGYGGARLEMVLPVVKPESEVA
ncbi:MAG: 7TM diverse intracellular signaling domain-containing protein [Pseudomonadota bacterium]